MAESETPIPPGDGESIPPTAERTTFELQVDYYPPTGHGDGEFDAVLTIFACDERIEGATLRELLDRVADALAKRGIR